MTQAYNLAILANAVDTSGRLNVGTNATGTLPVANGGTGTTSPSLVAGTNISISGTWPNQTITNTASAGGVTSLNGQTGAITNTNFNAIGSVSVGGIQGSMSPGSTYAGTSILQNTTNGFGGGIQNYIDWTNPKGNLGKTGTWRSMSYTGYSDFGNGEWASGVGIVMRVS